MSLVDLRDGTRVFIDANIFIYHFSGRPLECKALLERCARRAVSSVEEAKQRMKAAFHGEPQGCRYSFASREDLLRTLSPNRWRLIEALTGADPLGCANSRAA